RSDRSRLRSAGDPSDDRPDLCLSGHRVRRGEEGEAMLREGKVQAADDLRARIAAKTARVGVLGLGYVGLPLTVAYAEAGFPTCGLDVDQSKVETLRKGRSYIRHIASEPIARLVSEQKLHLT